MGSSLARISRLHPFEGLAGMEDPRSGAVFFHPWRGSQTVSMTERREAQSLGSVATIHAEDTPSTTTSDPLLRLHRQLCDLAVRRKHEGLDPAGVRELCPVPVRPVLTIASLLDRVKVPEHTQ